ncbi:MAG: fused MFS/spermidine synthase [Thermodesulfobacteriota bacterium]
MTKKIIWLVIATGIASIATQLVVIREFLTLFSGNEFVISITLFNWLFLGGCGTLLSKILLNFIKPSYFLASFLSFVLCIIGTIQIPVFRLLHNTIFIMGSSTGFYQVFVFTFLVSAPYCILLGYLLPFSLALARKNEKQLPSSIIYIADNFGDALGGAVFSFFLVWFFSPVQAIFLSSLPLLFLAFYINKEVCRKQETRNKREDTRTRKKGIELVFCIVTGIFSLCLMTACLFLEPHTLAINKIKPEFYRETPYARVAVYKSSQGHAFFQNSVPLFDTKNLIQAEKTVHYPLSQIENPESILLISAVSGVFLEIEKYPFKRVDYVEIDPQVSRALFDYSFLKPLDKMNVIQKDARSFLEHSNIRYDAIIMNLSDPDTFQVNRFFTREFFDVVSQHLTDKGVFSFSITGFNNYPSTFMVKKISSLYATLETCFENILVLPGSEMFFMARESSDFNLDIPALLRKKDVKTKYIENYFQADLIRERVSRLYDFIDKDSHQNRDFSPVLIKISFNEWFEKFQTSPLIFRIIISGIFLIYLFFIKGVQSLLFFTGFFAMAAQIMIIFAYQIFFGYIYLKIGFMITLFLAGLLFGAYFGEKTDKNLAKAWMIKADICLVFLMAGFILLLKFLPYVLKEELFGLAAFCFGFFCGFEFPCGAKIKQETLSKITGLFAADLVGASFGVLIFSLILLPSLGLVRAGVVLVVMKVLGLMRFLIWKN